MRIAICDDMSSQRELLQKYILEWGKRTGTVVQFALFESSEEFLFYFEDDRQFDLLVLDIKMGALSGMELAKKLRAAKETIRILFVTGFEEYMAQGYEVEALHYLVKPVQKEKLFSVLDRALRQTPAEEKQLFPTKEGMLALTLSELWYVEAQGHDSILHTADGQYLICEGIGAIRKRFESEPALFSCHRSLLVNVRHVSAIEKNELILDDNSKLPISRSMLGRVNQTFIDYYVGKERKF